MDRWRESSRGGRCSQPPTSASPPRASALSAVARSRARIGRVVMENGGQLPATIGASPSPTGGKEGVRGLARSPTGPPLGRHRPREPRRAEPSAPPHRSRADVRREPVPRDWVGFDQLQGTAATNMCRPHCSIAPLHSGYGMAARQASLVLEGVGALRPVPAKTMENVRRITTTPIPTHPHLRQQRCVEIQPLAAVRADTPRLRGHNAWLSRVF